ncbi:hypothetical protein PpBr36_08560 [Pyricularia pennisetigena]|nr:hypothetical protein PpBr36_08560 [Pyricularia pennisetigena]TLS24001.1 hypothetical protein PpBr36_08560 [Pyricularia pennisetigena]
MHALPWLPTSRILTGEQARISKPSRHAIFRTFSRVYATSSSPKAGVCCL